MPDSIACPYCRTSIPLENRAAARVVCPRCGETVDVHSAEAGGIVPANPSSPVVPSTSPRWFKPALYASCVLSVLILIGGLWWVYSDRPAAGPPGRTADGIPPPVTLTGLGYLPASVQVVAAVRPGPIVTLGELTNTNPRNRLGETGIPKPVLDALDRIGVPLAQIDHVAVGLTLPGDVAIPRIVLAIMLTSPPADESTVWKAIGAERISGGDFPRYKAALGGLPVQGVRATPTAYVFATEPKDLDGVESPRPSGGEHFRPALREAVATRLRPSSFAWVAAVGDDRWTERPAVKLLAKIFNREDLLSRFAPGRACVIGLSLEPDPRLRVGVAAEDVRPIGDWLAQQLAGEQTEVDVGDGWAVVDTPCPLSELPGTIGRLIPPARK